MVPNVAVSWETSEDGSEFTFKLREGLKWSDGEPFTMDDMMFFVEDLLKTKNSTQTRRLASPSGARPCRARRSTTMPSS
ncbi:ABC transporter substrate-binding protein [Fluviibacterium sp. DFM31]|uniref:ABC transporter substrate-binding protein n=1 Tax=Meridianimarinicoccus marinus TaxID=3231483 RepID=A0ABV3L923_9RHOB